MKLQKTLYRANETVNSMDRSLQNIKRTKDDDVDVEKFFQIYNKLFYSIQKTGHQYHTTIIKRSSEYSGGSLKNKNEEIKNLKNKILELEARVAQLDTSKDIIEFEKNAQEAENFELKNS